MYKSSTSGPSSKDPKLVVPLHSVHGVANLIMKRIKRTRTINCCRTWRIGDGIDWICLAAAGSRAVTSSEVAERYRASKDLGCIMKTTLVLSLNIVSLIFIS